MFVFLAYSLLFAAVVAGISLAVQYHRYQQWPAYQWRQRLIGHISRLQSRLSRLHADAKGFDRLSEALADECFADHLATIPIQRLGEFSGIGSATLDRLEQTGCRHLGSAVRINPRSIPGIGPARANDIIAAVQFLTKTARSQFEAGACPAAHAFHDRLEALRRDEEQQARSRQKEIAALDSALRRVSPLQGIADRITFWAFWRNQVIPGLTDELLGRPFPEPVAQGELVADTPKVVPARPPAPPVMPATQVARPATDRTVLPSVKSAKARPTTPSDLFQVELSHQAQPQRPTAVHPWLPKMRTIVEFGFMVAKADGRVAKAERKTIRAFLEGQFSHEAQLVRHIDPLMEQIEAEVADEVRTLIEICRVTNGDERKKLLEFAQRIAAASGDCNRREHSAVDRVAAAFGLRHHVAATVQTPSVAVIANAPIATVKSSAVDEVESRRLLEIPATATIDAELIRRRFRLLNERLDPTKAAALGPEFEKMAETKRFRLRHAAELLISPLKVPLDAPDQPRQPSDLRHNPDLDVVFGV